jgi:membrane-associated phospholipid phosphatase
MFLFFKRLLSVLALTIFITISLKAQSITQTVSNTPLPGANVVIIESDPMLGYAPDKMTLDSDLDLDKNTLKVSSTLNHKFNAQHNLQTGYLKNGPPTFQKDLFTKDISLKSVAFRRAIIAPVLFTAAGLFTLTDDNDDNYEIQAERNRYIPKFRNHADDYLQHAPIIIVYGLNWLGVKGKNDFANRTAILIKSEMMVGILTFSLKKITAVPRPDSKELTSFPSGHTAQAFAAATFMAREYGHKNILYSIGAYTMATGVGAMRVMNNRHWLSDVLVGAGIGILTTNLAYLTHQYRWGKGKKNKGGQTIVMPSYDGQTGMVNIIRRIT